MAETFTLQTSVDAWVSAQRNGRWGDTRLFVHSASFAYVYFTRPLLPEGSVITSAKLRLYPVETAVATVVAVNVHRLTSAFDPNNLVWANLPTVGSQVGTVSRQWYPTGGPAFEIDLTAEVQAMVNGQAWYGWRISSPGTNTEQAIWSGQTGTPPTLEVTYTVPPTAPRDLWPSGNAIVNASRPTLQWSASGGVANTQIAFQVQVASDSAFTTDLYTSNEINSDAMAYDLSAASPAFTALTNGQTRYWRVRVKNDMGIWSPYSGFAQFTYNTPPSLTITAPSGATTNDPTPNVTWTFSVAQAAFQVFVEIPAQVSEDRPQGQIYDSGIQYGAANTFTLPQGVIRYASPQGYRIRVRVWPTGTQIVSVTGRPTYFEATKDTAWVPAGIAAPTQIQASQLVAAMPWWNVRWEYTNATVPDYFVIRMIRNGKIQHDDWVVPSAVREGATNWYNKTNYGVRARADVTWEVFTYKAGVGTSINNPTITKTIVNLMPVVALQRDPYWTRFCLVNATIDSNLMEQSDVVQPVNGPPILVNWSYGRLMGSTVGTISWDAPLDPGSFNAEEMFQDFLYMRTNPKVIFVWQDQAIDAYIYNCNYKAIGRADGKTDYLVSFDWFQTNP